LELLGAKGLPGIADMGLEEAVEGDGSMALPITPIGQTSAVETNAIVAASVAKPSPAPAVGSAPSSNVIPQDVVTLSAAAKATPASAPATSAAPANAAPASAPPLIVASSAGAGAAASASSSLEATLEIQEQVQQLANQGLSANQIAANLNISVNAVETYLTAPQALPSASAATPGSATTGRITL
jgi:DNA-binding CsgD family transcriptional regulator